MKINSHTLSFETDDCEICLMYLGNENILIECTGQDVITKLEVPRFMLEKFIEIIQ